MKRTLKSLSSGHGVGGCRGDFGWKFVSVAFCENFGGVFVGFFSCDFYVGVQGLKEMENRARSE